jgi:23S rRNA pseudouridine2605 synthase
MPIAICQLLIANSSALMMERLQKIIAAAGIASRRKAEELIGQGRVSVNGRTVSELGSKADPERDSIKVDGKLLRGPERHIYLLLNKPRGYVTTVSDPEGRPTVMSLIRDGGARIYPVGRLDYASEGLLLLTNDGEFANKLTRASSHVPKTYLVKISGRPNPEDIETLRRGVKIGGKPFRARHEQLGSNASEFGSTTGRRYMTPVYTEPAQIRLAKEAQNPWYEVTLTEGRNRQIRRMFEEIGHHVEKIKRVRYGPLSLDVEPGQYRELTPKEVTMLRRVDAVPSQGSQRQQAAKFRRRRPGTETAEARPRQTGVQGNETRKQKSRPKPGHFRSN